MTPTEPIVRIRPTPNGRLVVIEGGRREPRRRPVPATEPRPAA